MPSARRREIDDRKISAAPADVDDVRLASWYGHLERCDVLEVPPPGFVFR